MYDPTSPGKWVLPRSFRRPSPPQTSAAVHSASAPVRVVPFRPSNPFWGFPASRQRKRVCLFASPPERWTVGGPWTSWSHQGGSGDGLGGWLVAQPKSEKKGETFNFFPWFRTVGVGASVAVFLAALVHFSFTRKGIKLQANMLTHALHGLMTRLESNTNSQSEDSQNSEQILEDESATECDASIPRMDNDTSGGKKRIIPIVADSTQQQALYVLKKLKYAQIIEDDVKLDELCTRREYARWLVRANSLLERNPRHKIVLSVVTGSCVDTLFDDVNVEDPDFWCIQALGEVGIVPCRVSSTKSNVSDESSSVNHRIF